MVVVGVGETYIKIKCRAVSGESTMSVTDARRERELTRNSRERSSGEREGEERGRRQERTNEGEGHIYRFPLGEEATQSSISNKFIVPESDARLD